MSKIAIIGAGLVGRSWAISFARGGHDAWLWDQEDGAAAAAVSSGAMVLPELEDNDLLRGSTREAVIRRLHVAETLPEALDGAVYCQESSPEDLEVKRMVFSLLDQLAGPQTILASSTADILPSQFSEGLAGADRCLVAHPVNPLYIIPAVEIVPAPWTRPDVVERAVDLLREIGHAPVVMARELEGFLINRLHGALLHEAFRLVAGGYAGVEDIDTCIRDGLAQRWAFMGPFETIDLNAPAGVRDYVARHGEAFAAFARDVHPIAWIGEVLDRVEDQRRQKLPKAALAARQAWRDRRLMALAAHKQKAAREMGA